MSALNGRPKGKEERKKKKRGGASDMLGGEEKLGREKWGKPEV